MTSALSRSVMSRDVWTIMLAAGAGRRLASVTGGVPKQFWRPEGVNSLLETSLDRLAPFSPPGGTVTVVDATHHHYLDPEAHEERFGALIHQPRDRGTATGVLLPLFSVLSVAPDAIVIISPADHGVEDERIFQTGIARAIARVKRGDSDIVLFGVEPSAASPDFGWITPARGVAAAPDFRRVTSFVEKPPPFEAVRLFSDGALWNTMVVVARGRALADLYRRHLPVHVDVFSTAFASAPNDLGRELQRWYGELPAADFCRDLLTPSTSVLSLYTWPREMGWSDLGTPERFAEWASSRRATIGGRAQSVQQVA